VSGGNGLDDALFDGFLGQFSCCPMRDGPTMVLGRLAGDGQDLAPLFGRDGRRRAWPLGLRQPLQNAGTRSLIPVPAPQSHGRAAGPKPSAHSLGVEPFGQRQYDSRTMGDPLFGFARSYQSEQLIAFII
jgi:hypothetical protein